MNPSNPTVSPSNPIRPLKYLRLSVTDRCNLRCIYCMPLKGVASQGHGGTLSYEGYIEIVEALVPLGLEKVRITGGEPLVRKGIVAFVASLSAVGGIKSVVMTTNGLLLPEYAKALKEAGLERVNISLDAIDTQVYSHISRVQGSESTLSGLKAALAEGLVPVKLNAVYLKGINDGEIEGLMALTGPQVALRFIELMPIGEAAQWSKEHFSPVEPLLKSHPELERVSQWDSGVAKYYRHAKTQGLVGAITPISDHFCATCDKVRLTSDGILRTCLHSDDEVDLKPYLGLRDGGETLRQVVMKALAAKPARHFLNQGQAPAKRNMVTMGG